MTTIKLKPAPIGTKIAIQNVGQNTITVQAPDWVEICIGNNPVGETLWKLPRRNQKFYGRRVAYYRRWRNYLVAVKLPAKLKMKMGLKRLQYKPRIGWEA